MLIRRRAFLCGVVISGLAAGGAWADGASDLAPDFQKDVLPIFDAKCIRCHGGKRRGGKLDMRTIHYKEMPPKKERPTVTQGELELLRKWIDAMPMAPAGSSGK